MMLELYFSFLPPGATLANVSEADNPAPARETKTVLGGDRKVSTTNGPILKIKKLRPNEVNKFV